MATPSSFGISLSGDRGGAELEGQRVQVDAAHLVADAGGALHLGQRIGALDPLHGRLFEELVVEFVVLDVLRVEDVFLARNGEPHRRQVEARIAPVPLVLVVPVLDIDEDDLAVVGLDARAADDVAVAVADGDDAHPVRPRDDLADPSAGQFLVIDVVAVADDANVVRAVDEGLVVDLDDRPVVVELLDDLRVVAALAAFLAEPLALLARVADVDALAFFGGHGLDVLGRDRRHLRRGVAFGRRTLVDRRRLRRLLALLGRLFAGLCGLLRPGCAGWAGAASFWLSRIGAALGSAG